jgi:predicted lipase
MANKFQAFNQNVPYGLTVHSVKGPSLNSVQLSKESTKERPDDLEAFPIYDELGSLLSEAEHHPNATAAHVLAVCAGYAYSDTETVMTMMTRMGLVGCNCRTISVRVDAMFIISTAYVIQSEDGKVVILAYRGTEPANFINWLTDVDLSPDKVKFTFNNQDKLYDIHAGFYRNFRSTSYRVFEALELARQGFSVIEPPAGEAPKKLEHRMKALYVTGHSLGAAMAAVMGIAIQNERLGYNFRDALRAVYTFGQPMIGSKELADVCADDKFISEKLIRIIYQKDPIPHVPPAESGHDWKHFGREYQFVDNDWKKNPEPARQMRVIQLTGAVIAFILRLVPLLRRIRFKYQLNDHGPQHYVESLTPRDKRTEFGDYDYIPPKDIEITPIGAGG